MIILYVMGALSPCSQSLNDLGGTLPFRVSSANLLLTDLMIGSCQVDHRKTLQLLYTAIECFN